MSQNRSRRRPNQVTSLHWPKPMLPNPRGTRPKRPSTRGPSQPSLSPPSRCPQSVVLEQCLSVVSKLVSSISVWLSPSPPPSLVIGQAGRGYVASMLLDRLGLTFDPDMFMFTLNFLFLSSEYIEFHTYKHTLLLFGDLCRQTGDPVYFSTSPLEPLYVSPLSWSTLLLKSLNLPVTLLETTRKLTSFQEYRQNH